MKNEVKAKIHLAPLHQYMAASVECEVLERSFDTCEQAWRWVYDVHHKEGRRRDKSARRQVVASYYWGCTSTGKSYGGMIHIHGAVVTPQNRESLASMWYAEDWFSRLSDLIKYAVAA